MRQTLKPPIPRTNNAVSAMNAGTAGAPPSAAGTGARPAGLGGGGAMRPTLSSAARLGGMPPSSSSCARQKEKENDQNNSSGLINLNNSSSLIVTDSPSSRSTAAVSVPAALPISCSNGSDALLVAVRLRPMNNTQEVNSTEVWQVVGGNMVMSTQQATSAGQSGGEEVTPSDSAWAFDRAFEPTASTRVVYEAIAEPIVSSTMAGINGTIFAYGQTASGKTHTMQGSEEEPGILRLAARQLFEDAARTRESCDYTFVLSYIEIYNERIKDLLTTATGRAALEQASDLAIREDRVNGFYVEGVTEVEAKSYEELMATFKRGEARRHVAGTDMNEKSSRSHTIFTVNIVARERPNNNNNNNTNGGGGGGLTFGALKARLSLVDLAGSENVRSTNAEGERLKEGGKINTSLLSLSRVISTLSRQHQGGHVSFRDSKLTQILQPSLAGNCRTAVVCCISPSSVFAAESLSTLKFAASSKKIRTQAVVNQIADVSRSVKSYQEQVGQLTTLVQREREARRAAEEQLQAALAAGDAKRVLLESQRREAELRAEMEDVHRDKERLETTLNTTAREKAETETRLNQLEKELEEVIAANRRREARLREEMEEERTGAREALERLETDAKRREAEARAAMEDVRARLEAELANAKREGEASETAISSTLVATRAELETVRRECDEAKERLSTTLETLKRLENELETMKRTADDERASVAKRLGQTNDEMEAVRHQGELRLAEMERLLASSNALVEELRAEKSEAEESARSRESDASVEIARLVSELDVLRNELNVALRDKEVNGSEAAASLSKAREEIARAAAEAETARTNYETRLREANETIEHLKGEVTALHRGGEESEKRYEASLEEARASSEQALDSARREAEAALQAAEHRHSAGLNAMKKHVEAEAAAAAEREARLKASHAAALETGEAGTRAMSEELTSMRSRLEEAEKAGAETETALRSALRAAEERAEAAEERALATQAQWEFEAERMEESMKMEAAEVAETKRRLQVCEESKAKLDARVLQLESETEALRAEVEALTGELESARAEIGVRDGAAAEEKQLLELRMAFADKERLELLQRCEHASAAASQTQTDLEAALARAEEAEGRTARAENQVVELQQHLSELEDTLKTQSARAQVELAAAHEAREMLGLRVAAVTSVKRGLEARLEESQVALKALGVEKEETLRALREQFEIAKTAGERALEEAAASHRAALEAMRVQLEQDAKSALAKAMEEAQERETALRERVGRLEAAKLTEKELRRIKDLKEAYDELKGKLERMGPADANSTAAYEERVKEAERLRAEAEERELMAKKIALERIAYAENQCRNNVKFLEKENLELMREMKRMKDELAKYAAAGKKGGMSASAENVDPQTGRSVVG